MANQLNEESIWSTGLSQLNIAYSEKQLAQLKQYVNLLARWNKTYNLTAVRNPDEMITLHIFDSLAIADYIEGENCLDIGSGAGLPTIPLAILQPERLFSALDTNGKKTRFIQQAVIELELKNVSVVQARVEKWHTENKFDAIVSRAFSSIHDFVASSSIHLTKETGVLYAMKGLFPEAEVKKLPEGFVLDKAHKLQVPFVDGERHLLEIKVLK